MESHLIKLRMQLYPSFANSMLAQIDSLLQVIGSLFAAGVFGGKASGSNVKDAVVQDIGQRCGELFKTVAALSGEGEGEEGRADMPTTTAIRARRATYLPVEQESRSSHVAHISTDSLQEAVGWPEREIVTTYKESSQGCGLS